MNIAHAGASAAIAPKRLKAGPIVAGGVFALLRFAGCALTASLKPLVRWQDRASQRRHLSMIDGHGLRDVGLSRADLAPEIRKPFWRA
jgi:uncharacterized protein YjiS (DUF1127 family)